MHQVMQQNRVLANSLTFSKEYYKTFTKYLLIMLILCEFYRVPYCLLWKLIINIMTGPNSEKGGKLCCLFNVSTQLIY